MDVYANIKQNFSTPPTSMNKTCNPLFPLLYNIIHFKIVFTNYYIPIISFFLHSVQFLVCLQVYLLHQVGLLLLKL